MVEKNTGNTHAHTKVNTVKKNETDDIKKKISAGFSMVSVGHVHDH